MQLVVDTLAYRVYLHICVTAEKEVAIVPLPASTRWEEIFTLTNLFIHVVEKLVGLMDAAVLDKGTLTEGSRNKTEQNPLQSIFHNALTTGLA